MVTFVSSSPDWLHNDSHLRESSCQNKHPVRCIKDHKPSHWEVFGGQEVFTLGEQVSVRMFHPGTVENSVYSLSIHMKASCSSQDYIDVLSGACHINQLYVWRRVEV
jgi:hypothetical protein